MILIRNAQGTPYIRMNEIKCFIRLSLGEEGKETLLCFDNSHGSHLICDTLLKHGTISLSLFKCG